MPDAFSEDQLALLSLDDSRPAALSERSLRFKDDASLMSILFAHEAIRQAHSHNKELALKHNLAVVNIYLQFISPAVAAAQQNGGAPPATAAADLARAQTSWRLGHALLVESLLPHEQRLSDKRRAELNLLAMTAPALDKTGEFSKMGHGNDLLNGRPAALPPYCTQRLEPCTDILACR